jgi:hypothetical protein
MVFFDKRLGATMSKSERELLWARRRALSGCSLSDLQRKLKARRDLSRLLAGTEHYDGRHFESLAARFRVSQETMAIRLEELALLAA